MGWACGGPDRHGRDVGYAVPAKCDHPDCDEDITRGVSQACGGMHGDDEDGCGLHFCDMHLSASTNQCLRCFNEETPFSPKPDTLEWVVWKRKHPSWQKWREENREGLMKLNDRILDAGWEELLEALRSYDANVEMEQEV